jgi:spermidine/putrescine transport system permease protein
MGIFLFMYIPIIVLVLFSFNDAEFAVEWSGFSLRWYHELFEMQDIWHALMNSLIVAGCAVLLSLTMGILLVVQGARFMVGKMLALFYGSLAIPEIVLAVGLLNFFMFFSVPLGLVTLIVSHTLIGLGYVVPVIHARFSEIDARMTEASLDLGASPTQTFFHITFPLLLPALITSALLVFVLSLDDFLVSFFCAGASVQTLPLLIFSLVRAGASPVLNALSTLLLVVSSLVVMVFSLVNVKKAALLE